MSIAEKLTVIAENEQKVYNAGYEKGKAEGGTGGTDYLSYSTLAAFPNMNIFGKSNVVLNIPYLSRTDSMFRPSTAIFGNEALNRTVEHITINSEAKVNNINMMFYTAEPWDPDNVLKHITLNFDTSQSEYASNFINGLYNLETVDGTPLDFSSTKSSNAGFSSVPKLAHIRVVPNTIKVAFIANSPALSNESIQSIIDGLADLTDGTAKTLTLHSTVGAKLTDEQKATITAKNWTLVY